MFKLVDCTELQDLQYVLRVLHDAGLAAKWRAIGQILTISDGDLDGFDTKFKGDPDLCLLQVVAAGPDKTTISSIMAEGGVGDC